MIIRYQSTNYKPEYVTAKYLSIDTLSNKPIILECNVKGYTIREYILPEELYKEYKTIISKAQELKYSWPKCVDFN